MSAVAGSLIGLLFVAITLRYERILGHGAPTRNQGMAKGAFVGLANALAVSLLAQVSPASVGWPMVAIALLSAISTISTQVGLTGRRGLRGGVFIASLGVFTIQGLLGVALSGSPHSANLRYDLADLLLVAVAVALVRSWMLLQPDATDVEVAAMSQADSDQAHVEPLAADTTH